MTDGLGRTLTGGPQAATEVGDAAGDLRVPAASHPARRIPVGGLVRTIVVAIYIYVAWYQTADFTSILNQTAIWGPATVGLGLVLGAAGQISLCQASFVLVGAYMYGTIANEWHGPTFIGLIGSALAGAAIALCLSPVLRARGYYLAIATMAVSLLVDRVVTTGDWIPGGNAGLIGVKPLNIWGYQINSEVRYLWLATALLVVSIALMHLRYGRGHTRR